MKLKSKMVLSGIVIAAILIFGIPVLINECYKHGGYITMWGAADVLSYYGAILGASIAIGTLVVTILFTRKQIQRESYLNDRKAHWLKIETLFTATLKEINPIPPMKEAIERGRTDPSEAVTTFQRYQMSCQTAVDEMLSYLSGTDYARVKQLVDQIITASNQCTQVAEEEISVYSKMRDFRTRINAQQTIDMENKYPGSVPVDQVSFCRELLEGIDGLSTEALFRELGDINEKLIAAYKNFYRPLLALKRTLFEQIDNEVQKEADSILHLWGK